MPHTLEPGSPEDCEAVTAQLLDMLQTSIEAEEPIKDLVDLVDCVRHRVGHICALNRVDAR